MCPLNDYCSCHEDDEAERQSDTACCPRQTIPDSCSCMEGCECMCLDCICDHWGDEGDADDFQRSESPGPEARWGLP